MKLNKLLLATLLVGGVLGSTSCSGNTLVVYTEAGFAPFEYVSGGSIVGVDNILATARILEKLTQVIVKGGNLKATAADVLLSAKADAVLKADSAHPSTSVGAITVKDYRFNIEVDKILTEVDFDGQIDAYDATLTAYDSITGDIRMDDTTIGGFTDTTGIAKINVKNQTAHVKSAGKINAIGNILERCCACIAVGQC